MTIDDQIEVSPKMIEAGMSVLDFLHYMDDQSDIPGDLYLIAFQDEFVAAVYRAMRKASDQEATGFQNGYTAGAHGPAFRK